MAENMDLSPYRPKGTVPRERLQSPRYRPVHGAPFRETHPDDIVRIQLNGKPYDAPSEASVAVFLERLGFAGKHVAVEVNAVLVPKRQHAEHRLAPGDVVEVVTLVGGG